MDLLNFMGEQQVMLMLKLDGLTVKLTYENGEEIFCHCIVIWIPFS